MSRDRRVGGALVLGLALVGVLIIIALPVVAALGLLVR